MMRLSPLLALLLGACAGMEATSTVDLPMTQETFDALPTMPPPPTPVTL